MLLVGNTKICYLSVTCKNIFIDIHSYLSFLWIYFHGSTFTSFELAIRICVFLPLTRLIDRNWTNCLNPFMIIPYLKDFLRMLIRNK